MYKWTDWRITIYVTVSKKASLRETQGFFIPPYFHAKKGTANAVPLGVGGFCCIPARRSLGWVASASFIERTIRLLHSFIPTKKGTANAVPFGGVVPSKSEPNSAVISSIVAVFEPSL